MDFVEEIPSSHSRLQACSPWSLEVLPVMEWLAGILHGLVDGHLKKKHEGFCGKMLLVQDKPANGDRLWSSSQLSIVASKLMAFYALLLFGVLRVQYTWACWDKHARMMDEPNWHVASRILLSGAVSIWEATCQTYETPAQTKMAGRWRSKSHSQENSRSLLWQYIVARNLCRDYCRAYISHEPFQASRASWQIASSSTPLGWQ